MIHSRNKRMLAVAIVVLAVVVIALPAFVAYRYTAPSQRGEFVGHPWRGWSFVYAALAVPGDSELKTSGAALRKADWFFKGTAVDPREVQLLYVPQDKPFTVRHALDGRTVKTTVTPSYRFIWQVQGAIDTIPDSGDTMVGLFDYQTGRVLYDVRDDLLPSELTPEPATSASPTPSPAP